MWILLAIPLIILLVISDQITKHLVRIFISPNQSIVLIHHFIALTNIKNSGIGFGLFQYHMTFAVIISLISLVWLGIFLWCCRYDWRYTLAISLITSGAIGNLINRVINGYVTDMIQTLFINYPVFNVADSCIVIGILVMTWLAFTNRTIRKRK